MLTKSERRAKSNLQKANSKTNFKLRLKFKQWFSLPSLPLVVPPWCAFCVVYHVTRRFLRYVFNRTISVALSWWRVNSLELQTLHKMKRQSETLTHKRKKRNKKKTWITKYKKKGKKTGAVRQSFLFFSVALNWINLRVVRIKKPDCAASPRPLGSWGRSKGVGSGLCTGWKLTMIYLLHMVKLSVTFSSWSMGNKGAKGKDTRRDQICMFHSVTEKWMPS